MTINDLCKKLHFYKMNTNFLDSSNSSKHISLHHNFPNINTPNKYGNVPLHTAIIQNDIVMLEYILSFPNADVNCTNNRGETPLFVSLHRCRSDDFVAHLIRAGCNPNIPNKFGETPLQLAIQRDSNIIACELIKRNVELDQVIEERSNLLHCAISNGNLEKVCMFLYYGADATSLDLDNGTPLMEALFLDKRKIAQVLFPFYDDLSCTNRRGYTALQFAALNKNPLALEIVKAGARVNYFKLIYKSPIEISLRYDNADLFKLIWHRLDHKLLLDAPAPFLVRYVNEHQFSPSDYLECLYLILQLPEAFDLLSKLIERNSFRKILYDFYRFNIQASDRMAVLNICLGMGFQANLHDLNFAIQLYGVGAEVNTLIYNFDCVFDTEDTPSPLLLLILGNGSFSAGEISKFLTQDSDLSLYRHFSLCLDKKKSLKRLLIQKCNKEHIVFNRLGLMREFPSLCELSRNAAYNFIHKRFEILKPYQFQDIVKGLRVPRFVQDVICFQVPIY